MKKYLNKMKIVDIVHLRSLFWLLLYSGQLDKVKIVEISDSIISKIPILTEASHSWPE